MHRKPLSTGFTITASILMVVVVLLALYVGGYYVLGKYTPIYVGYGNGPSTRIRFYKSRWLVSIYMPMARLESAITGDIVLMERPEDDAVLPKLESLVP